MSKLVLLSLGHGSVQAGFPVVTAQLWTVPGAMPIKFKGSLPALPELAPCYQRWQLLYEATYQYLDWSLRIKLTQGNVVQVSDVEFHDLCQQLILLINSWLSSDTFLNIDQQLRRELTPDDTVRVIIETNDPLMRSIPWHLWRFLEDYPKAEVALSASEYGRGQTAPRLQRDKVRVLAILGTPSGLDLTADRQLLESLPAAELVLLEEPARQVLAQHLWDNVGWDILFFAGHSQTEQDKGRIYLNSQESLTLEELKYSLRHAIAGGLQIAIFNSCDGLGLVEELAQLNLPQTIAMREPVPDQVAQVFLKHFLTAFAQGDSLYLAVRHARERLQEIENIFPYASWLPVICQNPAVEPLNWHELRGAEALRLPLKTSAAMVPQALLVAPTSDHHRTWPRSFVTTLLRIALLTIATTATVMGLRWIGWLEFLELKAYDQMVQLQAEESPDERLVIVEVTQADIERLGGEYPLQDATLLQALKTISAQNPSMVGVDIYRDRPQGEGWDALIQYLQQQPNIILTCANPDAGGFEGIAAPPNIPATQLGFADIVTDTDGTVRRHLLAQDPLSESACPPSYSLGTHLGLAYLQNNGIALEFPSLHHWQLGPLRLNLLRAHRGFYQEAQRVAGHQIMLHYRTYRGIDDIAEHIPLTTILNNQIEPQKLENKIILVGVSDPTIRDDFDTPYATSIRGLELHAQMVSQLVSAVEDGRTMLHFWPWWADTFWVSSWSLLGSIIAWRCRRPLLYFLISGGIGLALLGSSLILLQTGSIVAIVPAALGLIITSGSRPAIWLFPEQSVLKSNLEPN